MPEPPEHEPTDEGQRELLRHLVATLAYRAAKTLRGVPEGFATFAGGPSMRTPVQIVAHMGDLMEWGVRLVQGVYLWRPEGSDNWDTEVERFFAGLAALDHAIATTPILGYPPPIVFQGPIADALTHVGQLALLRGAAGAPVRPESYARAEIVAGRVGLDQAAPRREFDGDASERRRTPA